MPLNVWGGKEGGNNLLKNWQGDSQIDKTKILGPPCVSHDWERVTQKQFFLPPLILVELVRFGGVGRFEGGDR